MELVGYFFVWLIYLLFTYPSFFVFVSIILVHGGLTWEHVGVGTEKHWRNSINKTSDNWTWIHSYLKVGANKLGFEVGCQQSMYLLLKLNPNHIRRSITVERMTNIQKDEKSKINLTGCLDQCHIISYSLSPKYTHRVFMNAYYLWLTFARHYKPWPLLW